LIDPSFYCSSASNSDGMPHLERSGAPGAPDIDGAPGAPKGRDPQVSAPGAASNNETPITEVVHEADTTTAAAVAASSSAGEAAAGGPAATTGRQR
jgi:hypothetical protein